MKTPLAALREGVALLEDGVAGALSDKQREIARILRHNTASLQTQIEDLLRYKAAAFDAQHMQRAPVDLAHLLQSVIDGQRLQWQARGLQVQVQYLPGAPESISADSEKLGVALANLLSNAVRFSPDGGLIRFVVAVVDSRFLHRLHRRRAGCCRGRCRTYFRTFLPGSAPASRRPQRQRHRLVHRPRIYRRTWRQGTAAACRNRLSL